MRTPYPALAVSAAVVLACGGGSEPPARKREPLPTFSAPTWTAADSFTTIADVRRLSDGRTIVVDFSEKTVRMLDITGTTMATIGGEGSGPGEFRAPIRLLSLPAESTLVVDRTLLRFTQVWPPGRLDRTIPFPGTVGHPLSTTRGVLSDGRFVYQRTEIAPPGGEATSAIMAIRLRDARAESLFSVRIPQTVGGQSKPARATVTHVIPYTPEDDWTIAPDGAIAIVRVNPFHVEWRLPSGEIVNGPTQEIDAVPVTDSERAEWPNLSLPATKPPFVAGASLADPQGRVWVRRYLSPNSPVRHWSVFDRAGEFLGTVDLRGNRTIVHLAAAGAYVVRKDDNDIPWLEFYEWR